MSELIITTITKSEIQQLIENAVAKALLQNNKDELNEGDSFLDVEEAASFLGIAKATLYGKCSSLLIPHFKKGKKLYFNRSELVEYLRSGKRKTIRDISQIVNSTLSEKAESIKMGKEPTQ